MQLATMPMEAGVQLVDTSRNEPHIDLPYKEILRSFMYAATAT